MRRKKGDKNFANHPVSSQHNVSALLSRVKGWDLRWDSTQLVVWLIVNWHSSHWFVIEKVLLELSILSPWWMLTSDHIIVSGQCPLCWLGCENSGLGCPIFDGDGAIATLVGLSIITECNASLYPSLSISLSFQRLLPHVLVRGWW